jgi:hypothetical protein
MELMPKPSQILHVDGDYFYYLDSNNNLFKKKFKGEGVSLAPGEEVFKEIKLDTSRLMPQFIGGYVYFFSSGDDYSGYVYRYKLDGSEEEAELVSILADEDKKED